MRLATYRTRPRNYRNETKWNTRVVASHSLVYARDCSRLHRHFHNTYTRTDADAVLFACPTFAVYYWPTTTTEILFGNCGNSNESATFQNYYGISLLLESFNALILRANLTHYVRMIDYSTIVNCIFSVTRGRTTRCNCSNYRVPALESPLRSIFETLSYKFRTRGSLSIIIING